MAHPQTWPLSQDVNKSSGECSVCHAVRQLHIKDGTVHQHGPRHNRCPGSGKAPAVIITSQRPTSTPASTIDHSTSVDTKQSSAENCSSSLPIQQIVTPLSKFDHPLMPGNVIKHIPKSARPHCAAQLTTATNSVIADPHCESAWSCLLHFGSAMLLVPPRAGRRHNLSNILKRRSVNERP